MATATTKRDVSPDWPVRVPAACDELAERTATASPNDAPNSNDRAAFAAFVAAETQAADARSAHFAACDDGGFIVRDSDRYAVLGEHARGGLGRVLEVRDTQLDRTIAIKELLRSGKVTEARFRREALITARLEHPGIVPVHETGRWPTGKPYYAMKMVSGRTLKDVIEECTTFEQRLALLPHVLAVAEAVAYAHSKGIIHRDLKPSNVIVGAFGETVVIDWGLARDLSQPDDEGEIPAGPYRTAATDGLTVTGTVLGTPSYMPPEQARGDAVDQRADVYALGAMLYYLLAGDAPYRSGTPSNTLQKVLTAPPVPLAEREAKTPDDLGTIVAKAMAWSNPDDRYASARELAEDLRRFQSGQLVRAREYTTLDLLRRWYTRHRRRVVLAAAALITLSIGAGIAVQEVVAERETAQIASHRLILAQAHAWLERDPTATLAWLKHYPADGADLRDARQLARDAVDRGVSIDVIGLMDRSIADLQFSPDGQLVAACGEADGIAIWDTERRTTRRLGLEHGPIAAMAFTPDGRALVAAGRDGTVRVHPINGDPSARLPKLHDQKLNAIAVSPDGETVAAAGVGQTIGVWNLRHPERHALLSGHTDVILRVAFLDSNTLLSTADDGTLRYWDLQAGTSRVARAYDGYVEDLRVDRSARLIATSGEDKTIALWDRNGELIHRMRGHDKLPVDLQFFASATRLASAGEDQTVRVWDAVRGAELRVFPGHAAQLQRVVVSPDETWLASIDRAGDAWLWDLKTNDHRQLAGHRAALYAVAFAPDGRTVVTAGRRGQMRVWRVPQRRSVVLEGHNDAPMDIIELEDSGSEILTASWDGALRVWTLPNPQARLIPHPEHDPFIRVHRSGLGRSTVVACGTRTVRLWGLDASTSTVVPGTAGRWLSCDVDDQVGRLLLADAKQPGTVELWSLDPLQRLWVRAADRPVVNLRFVEQSGAMIVVYEDGVIELIESDGDGAITIGNHAGGVDTLQVSPDGRHVATGGSDGYVRVWGLRSGATTPISWPHSAPVHRLAFLSSTRIVAGDQLGRVGVGDLSSGDYEILAGHEAPVRSISVSIDGARFATAARDRRIVLWDSDTLEHTTLLGHAQSVELVRFGRRSERLLSLSTDMTGRVWDLSALPRVPGDGHALKRWLDQTTSAEVDPKEPIHGQIRTPSTTNR